MNSSTRNKNYEKMMGLYNKRNRTLGYVYFEEQSDAPKLLLVVVGDEIPLLLSMLIQLSLYINVRIFSMQTYGSFSHST